jgi:MoaA/NifB/PqqE/SkfB family radical SAM enzyme
MCPIETWTRPIGVMKLEVFSGILDRLQPYADSFKFTLLHGCGEPLLDKTLPAKVAMARARGFQEIHFATNATELTEKRSRDLLESGLHTIIFSIDGLTKQTHEAIRVRTVFEEVIANTHRFIRMRDAGNYQTKIWIRMIRQKLNDVEWPEYESYWKQQLDPARDKVVFFNVHNWGDDAGLDDLRSRQKSIKPITWCQDLYERIYIHCSGALALCCADDNGWYEIGNVRDGDPVEIFNSSPVVKRHRDFMAAGRIGELDHCRNCTIPLARSQKNY